MDNERLRQIENAALTLAAIGVIIAAIYGYVVTQREMAADARKIADAVRHTSPEAKIYNGS